MFYINKITSNSVIDYAAEELKKYLRMMMPEGGDVIISYNPSAKAGFRLGLMQDFGLDVSDAEDTELDDILYFDCDTDGGIIAGDNPRSVLLSVYEYLRQNGCRWLFPGVDGEFIPLKNVEAVKYRYKPSMRYRGQCNEGAEFQGCMLETIDFTPKVGMNVYMMEFRIPTQYYNFYYDHKNNEENRPSEHLTDQQILQWKRQCETEIAKRGLQFHDIGHGWTVDPFGIDAARCGESVEDNLTDENRECLAMINGARGLFNGKPQGTQFCMSNRRARKKFNDNLCDYAENHSNSDYLHVWLADDFNNHCECEECVKKTTSDWYMVLLNEADEELTRRNLKTRIVFIVYADTTWAPTEEKIKNPDRFTCLVAPISRSYNFGFPEGGIKAAPTTYVRNKIQRPRNIEEYFANFAEWQKVWHGYNISYEYHFWRPMTFDVTGLVIAKRVYEDVLDYQKYGVHGIIEDGTQRAFFPSAFEFYTYARTLYDTSIDFEEIKRDYFGHIYGEDYEKFLEYFEELNEVLPYTYLNGTMKYGHFAPDRCDDFKRVKEITKKGRELIKAHYNSPYRVRTLAVRLLEYHAEFCDKLSDCLEVKCYAKNEEAKALFEQFRIDFGKHEIAIERYFDHYQWFHMLRSVIFDRNTNLPDAYRDDERFFTDSLYRNN